MKFIMAIAIAIVFNAPHAFSGSLEIKVEQKPIQMPYWPAKEPHYGGVIIVQGGEPAAWSEFLDSLAQLLATNGWSTALINTDPTVTASWISQLPEAIGAVRQDKNKRIVLIHYGEQLQQTIDYFNKPQGKMINGLIMLSAYNDPNSIATEAPKKEKEVDAKKDKEPAKKKDNTSDTPTFHFPVLDIDGQFDYDMVQSQFAERKKQFSPPDYLSVQMPGANHQYEHAKQFLVAFMSGWMLKIPETATEKAPKGAKTQSYLHPIYSLGSDIVSVNDPTYSFEREVELSGLK